MKTPSLFILAFAIAVQAFAADDSVKFDNDQARVLVVTSAPGAKSALHEHKMNRVISFLTPAKLKVTTPAGESKTMTNLPGDVIWGGQAKHIEENLSDAPFEVVVVEFKK